MTTSSSLVHGPGDAPASIRTAARAVGVIKTGGTGEATVAALDGLSADIESVPFTAIMGPPRSGRSTVLHILAGRSHPGAVQPPSPSSHCPGGLGCPE